MAIAREKKPFAKALTKKTYQLGAPIKLLVPGYIFGLVVFMFTSWTVWEFIPLGLVWHLFAWVKFGKDPLYFSYLIDSLLEEGHLEP